MRKKLNQKSISLFRRTVDLRPEADHRDEVVDYILTRAHDFCGRVALHPGPGLLDVVLPSNSMQSLFRLPARRQALGCGRDSKSTSLVRGVNS